jgi:hypothetical protein
MHPNKFFQEVKFGSIDGGWMGACDVTDEMHEKMQNIHPTQLLSSKIKIPFFKIQFSYQTVRGNYREHEKYMFVTSVHEESDMEVEMNFNSWVEDYNRQYPHRKMLNVQILSIIPVANAILTIQ